nr:MAG TPA: hypothetical protein [Caudoviricetes sp.]
MPCGYNDLRAVRSATSEKMSSRLPLCGSIPTQSLCSGRCVSAIQVEPSAFLLCRICAPVTKTSARFSRADIREILNNATLRAILPCGYNDLRAVQPS